MTPLECGIIFDGIPEGAISRKVGLIWGIPDSVRKDTKGLLADVEKAIALDPSFKEKIREDEIFAWAREDPRVRELLGME